MYKLLGLLLFVVITFSSCRKKSYCMCVRGDGQVGYPFYEETSEIYDEDKCLSFIGTGEYPERYTSCEFWKSRRVFK